MYKDELFRAGIAFTLGCGDDCGVDVDEVLALAARVPDGDPDAWVDEWTAAGGEAWASAHATERRSTARTLFLRAGVYYGTALRMLARSSEPHREAALQERERQCWEAAIARFEPPPEPLTIPYQDTALAGSIFRAGDGCRPVVLIVDGEDAAPVRTFALGGAAAAARGYHWATFDAPGQGGARALGYRPDWGVVLTAVVDALCDRDDVDPERIAVIGGGQAALWIIRALAVESRVAAAVLDPGVTDIASAWSAGLAPSLRVLLENGAREAFDRELHLADLFAPGLASYRRAAGARFGVDGSSPFAFFDALAAYRVGPEVERVTAPVLVVERPGEHRWAGQARELFERLRGPKQLLHAYPDDDVFRWLDAAFERR